MRGIPPLLLFHRPPPQPAISRSPAVSSAADDDSPTQSPISSQREGLISAILIVVGERRRLEKTSCQDLFFAGVEARLSIRIEMEAKRSRGKAECFSNIVHQGEGKVTAVDQDASWIRGRRGRGWPQPAVAGDLS
ncbi:hypothetical protein LINPERHAP1_LOCUS8476 [Linum perenne]